MILRIAILVTILVQTTGMAVAQDAPVYRPFQSQGIERINPIEREPDRLREYVAPNLIGPERRDLGVVSTDINRKREPKLLPQDGDVRLRRQKGDLPVVVTPR